MRRSHHPTSAGARRFAPRLWATRFAAVLAVLLQVFVVQAHVHAPIAAAGWERDAGYAVALASEAPAPHAQTPCVLCQAQAGARALPPSADAIALAGDALGDRPPVEVGRVAVERAFSWQSRAPPAAL